VLNGVVDSDRPSSESSADSAEKYASALDGREAEEDFPQDNQARRLQQKEQILSNAQQRDQEAEARDVVSDKREMVADLEAFLDRDETYAGLDERRASAVDRSHAKSDRAASAQDRVDLTRVDPESEPIDSPEDP
jgi:hypothetical protein